MRIRDIKSYNLIKKYLEDNQINDIKLVNCMQIHNELNISYKKVYNYTKKILT